MSTRIAATLSLCLGICAAPASASADPSRKQGYTYTFDDDRLLPRGVLDGPSPPCWPRGPRPQRNIYLVRPRVQFVGELLRSVENM